MKKFNVRAFGMAAGSTWALCILLLSLGSIYSGWGTDMATAIMKLYIGYDLTLVGVVIGMIWAFVDMFIGAAIFAWLYNYFAKK